MTYFEMMSTFEQMVMTIGMVACFIGIPVTVTCIFIKMVVSDIRNGKRNK